MDEQLRQLIQEVVLNTDGSPQQKAAMNRLLKLIPQLPSVYISPNSEINTRDAFNRALEGVSTFRGNISGENIRKFVQKRNLNLENVDPEFLRKCFIQWFKIILKFKKIDVYREQGEALSLDVCLGDEQRSTFLDILPAPNPSGIEQLARQEEIEKTENFQRRLRRYLEVDPEQKLRNCFPHQYPQANCQEITKRRFFKEPPEKWKKLAQELNIPLGTVTSHWQRKCQSLLQEIAKSIQEQMEKE
ncbi:hypothetical protein [Oscillatoria salina]|uniref:hypothetical protein n=1 Tax=Oscillatoria salina TaxID=331517 RepID=UPI0013BC6887|nr:hypothetical protein [Oscillatoria salina]MBZ8180678.1 hypothetical protein [Oscillatoria salina IIICB1]NET87382.1 hypothetical protein [Kamptonema sp. SIO1D9]